MADFILTFVIEVILLPIALLIATPFILVTGVFGKDNYYKNVKEYYKKVIKWWKSINF